MNAPVSQAIDALQQSLTTLQTDMLQSDLIGSKAILRTIRASSSLENAKTAWGRFLNLPGGMSGDNSGNANDAGGAGIEKRDVSAGTGALRAPPTHGAYYTHEELWGRGEARSKMSKEGEAIWTDDVVRWEEQRARLGTENARVGRPFVV
jgi:hypothetical protein